jgi:hypothetical protein
MLQQQLWQHQQQFTVPIEPGIMVASQPPVMHHMAPTTFFPSSQQIMTSQHYNSDDFLPSSQQPLNPAAVTFTAAPAYSTLQFPTLQSVASPEIARTSNCSQ